MGIDMDGMMHDWQSKERLFGVIALGLGLITKEQLEECLKLQKKDSGDWRMLGTIMLEKGYMTENEIKQILDVQSKMNPRSP